MKVFIFIVPIAIAGTSCNKCLDCSKKDYSQKICNDMPIYKELKKGNATLTGENGNELKCK